MNYEIVNLEQKIIVGMSTRTTNENGESGKGIGDTWQKFFANDSTRKINNIVNSKGIGLYTEYDGDATMPYTFICGVEVSKASNDDFITKIIPAGKFAKFSIKGHMVEAVQQAWGQIWNMDLDRKYDFDFEVYHNDSQDINNQSIDIYISIN